MHGWFDTMELARSGKGTLRGSPAPCHMRPMPGGLGVSIGLCPRPHLPTLQPHPEDS